MRSAIDWLLNLHSLRFGQENVEFGFAHPLPGWAWAVVVLFAAGLAWWSYRRLEGGARWRGALGVVRGVLLILLVVLIAGPRLVKANESEEQDWVLVLVDRSASMGIKDAPPTGSSAEPAPGARRVTREEQLHAALGASEPVWEALSRDRTLVWLGFDSGAYDIGEAPSADKTPGDPAVKTAAGPGNLKPPVGRQTALGRALEQGLRRAAARPISGVVIFSDGRSIDEPARAIVRRLQADHVPVHVFPLGSAEPVADVAVRSAQGPPTAFVNDFVPVEVEFEQLGMPPGAPSSKAKAQLVDQATGLVLDEQEVDFAQPAPSGQTAPGEAAAKDTERVAHVTLTTKAGAAGKPNWLVRIVPTGPDLISENNTAPVTVELVDKPIRVAYFDGYPRWEYRYLKNLLVREKSFTASTLILSSGRRYVQEGEQTMAALPRSPEEWARYDVIVMGDVRPEVFTPEQLAQIKEHVAVRGAGLLWIGGEGPTPVAWRSTPLADLLPMVVGENVDQGIRAWDRPVNMAPTALAERLGVLRLSNERRSPANGETVTPGEAWWPQGISDFDAGWSTLRWAQRIDSAALKPTAEVLAVGRARRLGGGDAAAAPPAKPGADVEEAPLVVAMRFGAGRVVYVGTDEVWRWRYGRGEMYPERFWLQMIRLLGRESLSRSGHGAILEVTPKRAEVDQAVRVAVQLVDQSLVDTAPGSLHVRLVRDDRPLHGEKLSETDRGTVAELRLLPEVSAGGSASATAKAIRTFAATWAPTESGRYKVEVDDPFLAGASAADSLATQVEVWLPDDELRHPETNHPLLARLAQATDGRVLDAADLTDLPKYLPNRGVRLAGEPEVQTLWDTPLALILTILLLTIEWVGRRLIRLA